MHDSMTSNTSDLEIDILAEINYRPNVRFFYLAQHNTIEGIFRIKDSLVS